MALAASASVDGQSTFALAAMGRRLLLRHLLQHHCARRDNVSGLTSINASLGWYVISRGRGSGARIVVWHDARWKMPAGVDIRLDDKLARLAGHRHRQPDDDRPSLGTHRRQFVLGSRGCSYSSAERQRKQDAGSR